MAEKEATKEEVEQELKKNADSVSQEQVEETLKNESKLEMIFRHVGKLSQYWDEVKVAYSMIKDYVTGSYKQVPWRTVATLVAALAYVLLPFDLVPDFIPIVGWSDDCFALAGALAFAKMDLEQYKTWKNAQKD